MRQNRRVSQHLMDSNYVYVPPHKRQENFHSLRQSQPQVEYQAPTTQPVVHHNKSRSFEVDLSKKQNTFGLMKTQDSNTQLGYRVPSGQKEFVSPKFKISNEETKFNDNILTNEYLQQYEIMPNKQKNSLHQNPKSSLNSNQYKQKIEIQDPNDSLESIENDSIKNQKIESLQNRLQQKEQQLEKLLSEINNLIQSQQQELMSLTNEKNRILEQQNKQIAIYILELNESRMDLQESRKEVARLRAREQENKSNILSNTNKENQKSPNNLHSIFNTDTKHENQLLKSQVAQLKIQINFLQSQIEDKSKSYWNSPLNDSSNIIVNTNQLSIIEPSKLTDTSIFEKTFKNLADELNLTIDPKNQSQSFMILNNEVLEGVKTLKNINKEQQKFIRCLKELVQSCAPKVHFNEPSLKEMWKFIKQVLNGYLEGKKTLKFNQDTINQLCQYLVCQPQDISKKTATLVVDNEVLGRISDKVRQILNLPQNNNLRELDRQFELAINK